MASAARRSPSPSSPSTPPKAAPAATVGVASWAASDLTRPKPKASTGPQTFAKPPGKGVERLKVGYRMVRLSEGVDDVSSRELGRLDRGDEVEVIGSYEGFLQVKTPDGLTGWIPGTRSSDRAAAGAATGRRRGRVSPSCVRRSA